MHYFVKWKGFTDQTWEARKDLLADGCKGAIADYEALAKGAAEMAVEPQMLTEYELSRSMRISRNDIELKKVRQAKAAAEAGLNTPAKTPAPVATIPLSAAPAPPPMATTIDMPSVTPTMPSPDCISASNALPAMGGKRPPCSPADGSPVVVRRSKRAPAASCGLGEPSLLAVGDVVLARYQGREDMERLKATVVAVGAGGTFGLKYKRGGGVECQVLRKHIKVSREKLRSSPDN